MKMPINAALQTTGDRGETKGSCNGSLYQSAQAAAGGFQAFDRTVGADNTSRVSDRRRDAERAHPLIGVRDFTVLQILAAQKAP